MQVERLHYLLELQWNKLSNNQRTYLTDLEKDTYLNIAIKDYFEIFGHGRNPKGINLGFEVIQQRKDQLNTLVREVDLIPTLLSTNKYFMEFPEDYGTYSTCRATIEDCTNTNKVVIEQHGDKDTVLNDHHRKPSKKWAKCVGFEINGGLNIHTDNQVVTSVELTYWKKPDEVALGTYNDIPSTVNPNPPLIPRSNTDLPDKYEDLVVQLAIWNLSKTYNNQISYQLTKDKIQTTT